MRVLFIADKFDDEPRDGVSGFPGGAELTDAAIIDASPHETAKKKIREVTRTDLDSHDLIIIGNSKTMTSGQLRYISADTRYILFEHDMRICRYDGDFLRARKEPVHYYFKKCICPHIDLRKLYRNSLGTIFLTKKQYNVYRQNPFFRVQNVEILGCSAFDGNFLKRAGNTGARRGKRSGWAVFYSPHPVKGTRQSEAYCSDRGIIPVRIFDMMPDDVYSVFENSEQFVYLPAGIEWAGRMPVEARLLGCKVVVNENVGVTGEPWWEMDDAAALNFVRDTPARFWRLVEHLLNENTD